MILRFFILAISFWQNVFKFFITPTFGVETGCRFSPSCSEFTKQAISKYGVIMGVKLGAWRILRCQPLLKGGVDFLK